jgi:transcriptional regulator with XRE-family HTH domain
MTSDTTGIVHQGEIAAEYRRRRKWSRAKLAGALGVDESTVYRMEHTRVIKNLTRRKLLVGILGIPAELMGLDAEQRQPLKTNLVLNDDHMAFFEDETAIRWDMYRTGGTMRAYRGLDVWLQEVEAFAQAAQGSVWHQRAYASLSMSYQLQGSIFADMMKYDQAHHSHKKAYHIAKELDEAELMAATLARRGVTSIQQNKPLEAIEYLSGALKLISGRGFSCLRGYTLKALSEAHAMTQHSYESMRHIELAERTLEHKEVVLERSHCQLNKASVIAQKGINAVLLHDYERAVALIDKSLLTYDPTFIRGRSRLLAQKAEAYYGLRLLDYCIDTAEEAFMLADSVGSSKTVGRLEQLHTSLLESRWRKEVGVARLGALLAMN